MPPARLREPIVPVKVREGVRFMFETTPTPSLQEMAERVGIETRKLRFLLQQPHVLRFVLAEKQLRLETASAGNIPALLSIRDYGDNQMARVHAAKTIETMLDNTSERTGIGRQMTERRLPGLQIVIVQPSGEQQVVCGPPPAPLIEATPESEVVPVTSDTDDDA
jgi:hypothetical protein